MILRSHYTQKLAKEPKYIPWAFGLTNRIINEVRKTENETVKNAIYISYRVSQNLRELLEHLLPFIDPKYNIDRTISKITIKETKDKYDYWNQTGKRHEATYYQKLNQSLFSFAFGGILTYKTPRLFYKIKETIEKYTTIRTSYNFDLIQYDSWRFWEILLSNSCPIHLELSAWKAQLPIMPKSGIHYIGVKNLNFHQTAQYMNSLTKEKILQIGKNGKQWVLENYNPRRTSERFLDLI